MACLPALLWLTFFLREDECPEPPRMITQTFIVGALMSGPAIVLQLLLGKLIGSSASLFIPSIVILAASEELVKFIGVYATVRNSGDFDQPVDAMIYLVVAGLGFATVENMFVMSSFYNVSGLLGLVDAGQTLLLRFIGATLLHTLASAIIGYFWARGIVKNKEGYFIIVGLFFSVVVHGIFNYLVYIYQNVNLLYPSLFLIAISFFVFKDFEDLKHPDIPS